MANDGIDPNCRPRVRGRWLKLLASLCFNPSLIIDIGANVGMWSRETLRLFPSSRLLMVDGNDNRRHWSDLRNAQQVVAILDRAAGAAPWFTNPGADTGASLLKEQTPAFAGTAGAMRRTQTLDGLLSEQRLGDCAGTLLKLDVQGAEVRRSSEPDPKSRRSTPPRACGL